MKKLAFLVFSLFFISSGFAVGCMVDKDCSAGEGCYDNMCMKDKSRPNQSTSKRTLRSTKKCTKDSDCPKLEYPSFNSCDAGKCKEHYYMGKTPNTRLDRVRNADYGRIDQPKQTIETKKKVLMSKD